MEPMEVDLDYQPNIQDVQWKKVPNSPAIIDRTSTARGAINSRNAQQVQQNSYAQNTQHIQRNKIYSKSNIQEFQNVVVVDTNILLSELQAFRDLVNHPERFHICQVVVPYVVLDELDYQKMNGRPENKKEAQNAIRFVNQHVADSRNCILSSMVSSMSSRMSVDDENGKDNLENDTGDYKFFIIEKHRFEVLKDIGDGKANDDKILAVCVQRQERIKQVSATCSFPYSRHVPKKRVVFLTNDKNLQNKAIAQNIVTKSLAHYRLDFHTKTSSANSSPGPKKKRWYYGNSIGNVSLQHSSLENLLSRDRWSDMEIDVSSSNYLNP